MASEGIKLRQRWGKGIVLIVDREVGVLGFGEK